MAVQTTPHTQPQTEVDADSIDMQTAENPQPYDTGNAIAGDTDGAQTAGKRSFHVNGGSGLPKEVSEGTADIGADQFDLPKGSGTGASNAPAAEERAQQEKVVGGGK